MKYIFQLVAASQFLYSPEVLETTDAHANEMATELSRMLFHPFIYNVTDKPNQEIPGIVVMSHNDDMRTRAMVRAT